jgi:hypothetical protein
MTFCLVWDNLALGDLGTSFVNQEEDQKAASDNPDRYITHNLKLITISDGHKKESETNLGIFVTRIVVEYNFGFIGEFCS